MEDVAICTKCDFLYEPHRRACECGKLEENNENIVHLNPTAYEYLKKKDETIDKIRAHIKCENISSDMAFNPKMEAVEKWAYFKNFLHNTLGISKYDIRSWIKEAAREEAKRLVDNECGSMDLKAMIREAILYQKTRWGDKEISSLVKDAVNIAVKDKIRISIVSDTIKLESKDDK